MLFVVNMDDFSLLLVVYFAYLIASVKLFNLKIISPSVIFLASFTFMLFLAYSFRIMLDFRVSSATLEIFLLGGGFFILTELVVKNYYSSKNVLKLVCNRNNIYINKRQPIFVRNKLINALMLLFFISFLFALYVMFINTSGGSFSARMEQYKELLLYSHGRVKYRFVISQLYKINTSISYVLGYILIYNFSVCNVEISKMKKNIYLIVLFCLFSMVAQAARQPAFELLLFLGLVYLSLNLKKDKRNNVKKFVLKIIPVLIGAVFLFFITATMVGRRQTERSVGEYLAVYFCGGLYSFDLHVTKPARNNWWGQSSFADIYSTLIDLRFIPESVRATYRDFDLYGNTVTMFGRWYEDFGSIGVYLMTIIVAFSFSRYFYKVIDRTYYIEPHIGRLIYCKFLIALLWAGYDDRIRALLSFQTLILLILIPFIFKCLTRHKISR